MHPTPQDLDAIGVAIRVRLDISRRPVKVDTLEPDRVGVTICGSTDPDADRRLILAHGALTVVPLPPGTYGTAASPGGTALPAAGHPDRPVAAADRAAVASGHHDGPCGSAHRASWARDPPVQRGDRRVPGVRLEPPGRVRRRSSSTGPSWPTIPIDGRTRNGNFVFTGDYTEAETRLMASYLYQDPIRFDLQPTADIEVPSR